MTYPILEFDPNPEAMIEPSRIIRRKDVPTHCVFTFFRDVATDITVARKATPLVSQRWESGHQTLYEIEYRGHRLAYAHVPVGAAAAGNLLEEMIARGCEKFMVCGGCGVLEPDIAVGNLIVVSAAVRDEGLSYHYQPPAREIQADPRGIAALETTLQAQDVPYQLGKTWTTDAPFRETPGKVVARRQEGCLVVEMEAAALMAVAQFRRVVLGQVLYGGDDLSGNEWDNRNWQSQPDIRRSLFWLAADACLAL